MIKLSDVQVRTHYRIHHLSPTATTISGPEMTRDLVTAKALLQR